LTQAGVEYRVVKNKLLKLAAEGTPAEELRSFCTGPTAIALSGDDPVAPAKILSKFAKEIDAFELKAGVLSGKLMTVAEINALADLPSRDELLAKALSSMNAPVSNFVGTMAAIPRSLVQVLNAIGQNKAA
jgi:large subunit ribosomal protein L10